MDKKNSFISIDDAMAMLFPIGGLLLLNNDSNPNEIYEGTQWELVSQDRYLCGAGGKYTTSQQVEAGLPNITGEFYMDNYAINNRVNGVFEYINGSYKDLSGATSYSSGYIKMDASKSSNIYGNSDTVTPSTLAVNIWQRIA